MTSTESVGWVPGAACTLPTVDRPLRLSEFEQVFTAALIRQERTAEQRLRWRLDAATEATIRDLTVRETECCAFFTFPITPDRDQVTVDVEVPPAHVDVLNALEARARTAMAAR